MVEVCDRGDGEVAVTLQVQEQMEQRDRIGASGQGDEHTIVGAHQCVRSNRAPDALAEKHLELVNS